MQHGFAWICQRVDRPTTTTWSKQFIAYTNIEPYFCQGIKSEKNKKSFGFPSLDGGVFLLLLRFMKLLLLPSGGREKNCVTKLQMIEVVISNQIHKLFELFHPSSSSGKCLCRSNIETTHLFSWQKHLQHIINYNNISNNKDNKTCWGRAYNHFKLTLNDK